MKRWLPAVLVLTALPCSGLPSAQAASLPRLNRRVVGWARSWLGRRVGNGKCWTLADRALARAGAQRPGKGGMPLYAFGRPVPSGQRILPGDVVQFERASFARRRPDGGISRRSIRHHTAIVYRVRGPVLTLLEQNVGGKRHVRLGRTIDLRDYQRGLVAVYRPTRRWSR
jgi:hypothetical protein